MTGNVTNALLNVPHDGIVITSSNVTVDLNGFTMDGFAPLIIPLETSPEPQGLGSITSGVRADGTLENIIVRNGIIRNWSGMGIRLSSASNTLIEGVAVSDNGGVGIWGGDNGVVTRCVAQGNSSTGVIADEGSTVTECTASENDGDGISINPGGIILASTARGNGMNGIFLSHGSSAVNCAASENAGSGIRAHQGSTIRGCNVRFNDGDGIHVDGNASHVVGNTCAVNGDGDDAGILVRGPLVSRDRIEGNSVRSTPPNVGIRVIRTESLIIGNYASSYDIEDGNHVGTIRNTPVGAGPWDNFEF